MKLGVSSYSFVRLVRSGAMSQLDVIAKTKELGFDVIEFSTFELPEGETPLSFAPKVREECDRVGLQITNYTIGADFLNGSGGDLESEVERVKEEVCVAEILGTPGMRHDATRGFLAENPGAKSFAAAVPRVAEGCRAVTEFAASRGIRTMVENHGFFCQDSARVEQLICAVDHPNFGALIDMGNFICADDDPGRAVGLLAPYAFHVHAKDFHLKPGTLPYPGEGWGISRGGNFFRGAIIGHGDVPIRQCLRILKRAGFDGVLSIEFEGMEEPLTGIRLGFENLKRSVGEIYG
ncbi:sugar phosphate isomerase/epimerase [bacterium]|nr:sugar phosphate isomerase/epimerase [bacterium]